MFSYVLLFYVIYIYIYIGFRGPGESGESGAGEGAKILKIREACRNNFPQLNACNRFLYVFDRCCDVFFDQVLISFYKDSCFSLYTVLPFLIKETYVCYASTGSPVAAQ